MQPVTQAFRICLRHLQLLASMFAVTLAYCLALPAHAIDLADYPLFSTIKVPGNVALALSVEWPTATSAAYLSTTAYATATTYIGYFDPAKCYQYVYNTTTPANSYFKPVSAATSHVCSGMWSGNYLNYVSMQTLDEFRWIMTGGYRSVDTNTATSTSSTTIDTVLTKTWSASNRATSSNVPNKTTTLVSGATPFTWSSATTRIWGLGSRMWITGSSSKINSASSATAYTTQSGSSGGSDIYEVYVNVAACVSATLKEDNCVLYGNTYKPEGLMQQYALQLRFAAFSYLLHSGDTTQQRDGGVMRARMNYIGPTKPVPGSANVTNTDTPEWSATTGIMLTNPDAADATDTNSTFGISVSNSGAMNYLNKFGYSAQDYKSKDPVSELYNTVLRYFKGLGNVASYTTGTTAAYADGFPVITKWRKVDSSTMGADPIVYSCQKNFILGIGDVNTHRDANLYGSTLRSSLEPTMPSEISADTSVNVTTATNMVGTLEGKSGLGSIYAATGNATCTSTSSQCNTFYIAGLAYDAHTVDLRATLSGTGYTADNNMSGAQTINTYWLDVMEDQEYMHKNQYWLAAKYGGFTVPNNFSPYASSNNTSTLADSSWYTNSDTAAGLTTTSTVTFSTDVNGVADKRPDNYFFGNKPDTMKSSLTAAFDKISSELSVANSTTYAMTSPNVSTGDAAYSATYDPSNWTSSLYGASVSYDASGDATTTVKWNARDKLEALSTPATSRKIVTYCDSASTPSGIAFTATALAGCPTTGRLYYASFANITGATSTSTTPAADYVAYLRGSRTNELSASVTATTRIYRKRDYLLGDIVNSKTTAVGKPAMSYYDVYNPGYSSFKSAYATRRTVVYAGSNDGMLHAFDGTMPGYVQTTTSGTTTTVSSDCTDCGQELFAYIPSFVYGTSTTAAVSGLASIGSPTRSHYYQVDATPLDIDMDLNNVCVTSPNSTATACSKINTSTPDWRTLLIGGLGKGGKGFYAIDITNPGLVSSTSTTSGSVTTVTKNLTSGDWTSEAAMATKVLWEFPKTSDTTTIARMGYSYGAPTFLKTKKYGWVVVFTSGYNNTDGKGYFFFVNPRTGALLETVVTPEGSTTAPLNLAQADAYISNKADFTGDAIYAGDMQGNLWRLDVSSSSATYAAPVKLATLYKTAGTPQPVTTRPLIEVDSSTSKRFVLIGTGRLLADSDVKSAAIQSIYSVYDGAVGFGLFKAASSYATPLARSDLVANTSVINGIGSSPSTSTGWYLDLSADSSSPYIAERINVDPAAYDGSAFFGVNLPNGSICSPSGTGYVLGLNIATGKSVLQDSTGAFVAKSTAMAGVITELSVQNVNGTVRVIAGDSTGTTATTPSSLTTSTGLKRMNWREVSTQ
jgi:type IV pilus assembly protein PilY1